MRVRGVQSRTRERKPRAARSAESGYVYALGLFIILAVIIGSQVALQVLATEGRRERESEMIWRGNQWARAVRLYFHKTGHYPQSVDDLQKGLPELHFLRLAAYKDPMNTDDGSWRFIYVNGGGQIIGSVRYATLQQMALMDLNGGQIPGIQQNALPGTPVSSMTSSMGSSSTSSIFNDTNNSNGGNAGNAGNSTNNTNTTNSTNATNNTSNLGTGNQGSQGSQPGDNSSSQSSPGAAGNSSNTAQSSFSSSDQASPSGEAGQGLAPGLVPNPLSLLKPTGPVDGPVIGAFITGVGSKQDRASVRIYHGGKKYKDWEFIWNPLEDQAQALQQGLNNIQQQPGQMGQPTGTGGMGTGSSFGNPIGGGSIGQGGMPGPQPSPTQPNPQSP